MPGIGRGRKGRSLRSRPPGREPTAYGSPRARVWAWVLGSWFGAGLAPWVPGTVGTAAALPLLWFLGARLPTPAGWTWSPWCLLAALLLFYPAVLASTRLETQLGRHDPAPVVVDEVVGTLLTAAFLPAAAFHDWRAYAAVFILFRILDVWKPGLIGRSQTLPRGWGIVMDDALAGSLGGLLLGAGWIWGVGG